MNNISTARRNAACDGIVDGVDIGSGDATGDTGIYSASFAALLALMLYSNPAFGAASSGTATASAITDDSSADATGTAAVGRVRDRDNATVWEYTVSTSGADLNLNTTGITAGDRVAITSFTVTMPAS